MEASSLWSGVNSGIVLSLMAVVWTMLWQGLQSLQLQHFFGRHSRHLSRRLAAVLDPYLTVTVAEYDGGRMRRSDAYKEAQAYLQRATREACGGVRHLKAEPDKDPDRLVLSMDDNEEVADEFKGATVWWLAYSAQPREDGQSPYFWGRASRTEKRFYRLCFLERDRDLILGEYLPHVRREGRAVMVKNRQRKLFTNISGDSWDSDGFWSGGSAWSHVVFEHPKTFATLAMDPAKKKEIMEDLDAFRNGKDYYARVGKAWKRGYLLYGPPGTGKSTMIAAMANYLDYDVYDIELTSVRTNTDLRKLFIETTSKSIIVIEDIDCSLDLTGKRKKKKKAEAAEESKDGEKKDGAETSASKEEERDDDKSSSKVTLSGVLNFIDGLWSACGGERIIVFTTNHVEKLDPALIRRGRMDKHIEMSYCCVESFRFLTRVYLDADDSHPLFGAAASLLREVDMTPADVAENLTPKGPGEDADSCLAALVEALQKAKEKALAKKAKEEAALAKKKAGGKGKEEAAADEANDNDDE
ncbi:AAA-ATPase [Dichanthelium oligosanthes]|uniref:AAA-ATPase n=1 Tax=Dichanthelium oligosanthes TaxID=888268 RepID=A0A1E5VBU6_9POAL|nr:AAA-ATPase [Dichanthelium oligosanthes]